MLSRATSMPASTSSRISSGVDTAGPRVQTIFALRTASSLAARRNDSRSRATWIRTVPDAGRRDRLRRRAGARSAGSATGRVVEPVRNASTAAAAARPSAIAQTISDWPRPASPATKTPVDGGGVRRRRARRCRARRGRRRAARPGPSLLRAGEAHREQHQLGRDLALGALDRLELRVDLDQPQRARRGRRRRRGTPGSRRRRPGRRPPRGPRRPGRSSGTSATAGPSGRSSPGCGMISSWVIERGALAGGGAEAVGAGVAAADDHDVLAVGGDLVLDLLAERDAVGLRQELHRLVDAAELAAGHRQVARQRWRRWRARRRRSARAAGRR